MFAGLPDPLEATRYHSLAVDPATVPAELEVTGTTPSSIVMALQTIVSRDLPSEETAVVSVGYDGPGEILSNEVLSQIAEHAAYGGVVPEIAARAHVEVIDRLVARDQMGDLFKVIAIHSADWPKPAGFE